MFGHPLPVECCSAVLWSHQAWRTYSRRRECVSLAAQLGTCGIITHSQSRPRSINESCNICPLRFVHMIRHTQLFSISYYQLHAWLSQCYSLIFKNLLPNLSLNSLDKRKNLGHLHSNRKQSENNVWQLVAIVFAATRSSILYWSKQVLRGLVWQTILTIAVFFTTHHSRRELLKKRWCANPLRTEHALYEQSHRHAYHMHSIRKSLCC